MPKDLNLSFLLDCYGEMLTEKQKALMDYYYNQDLSLAEIAENEGITRQGVRDSVKRAETQLYEMEQKLGIFKKTKETQKLAADIRKAAGFIAHYNEEHECAEEISKQAERIGALAGRLI